MEKSNQKPCQCEKAVCGCASAKVERCACGESCDCNGGCNCPEGCDCSSTK